MLTSKNYLNKYGKEEKAYLSMSCYKEKNGKYQYGSLTLNPPSSLYWDARGADFKWDDEQSQIEIFKDSSRSRYESASFRNSKRLIKKLAKHSKLQIRFFAEGPRQYTAEFALTGKPFKNLYLPIEEDISKFIEKCS